MTKSSQGARHSNSGKLAVAGMFGAALLLAGFAWWWNWQRTQRTLDFYGGQGASLIRTAEKVEGLALSAFIEDESKEQLTLAGQTFEIVARRDLSKAQGLVHARTALLDDSSYRWSDGTTGDCEPAIGHAVRFSRGSEQITLAFDFGCRRVWIVESERQATMAPKIATGWESFLTRRMGTKSSP